MREPAERLLPLLIGLGVLLLYLAIPSQHHNFDGVACAIAVELGDLKHLVHGNHLLYGLVGLGFHRLCGWAGLHMNALWALQILDSILGALGAGMMYVLLRRAVASQRLALLGSIGMALSYGYWFWSLEAQVYLLGLVLLLGAFGEALKPSCSPYRLAVWHGLAMLSHGANILFAPVAFYALRRQAARAEDPAGFRRQAGRYMLAASLLVLAGYAAAAVYCVRPADWNQTKLWLLGSLMLGQGRSFLWHGEHTFASVLPWLATSAWVVSPLKLLSLPLWAAAIRAPFRAEGGDRDLARMAWLWLPCYALLFLHWQPYTLVYRVSDLVPLWLLAAIGARPLLRKTPGRLLCFVYLGALGAANLAFGILPASRPENNPALQEALWLRNNTPEDAWIVVSDIDQVYVPYFAHRHPLNIHLFDENEDGLRGRLQELLGQGRPVFVTESRLKSGWEQRLSPWRPVETLREGGRSLYKLQVMEGKAERKKVEKVEDGARREERAEGYRLLPLDPPAQHQARSVSRAGERG